MKKVLVFGMTENPGGVESVIMNYYRNIDRNKIQFDFLCNTEIVAYSDEIEKLGGKIYKVTARSKNRKKFYHELDSFFKNHSKEYEAIWVNVCSLANIDYLKCAKKYNIKTRIIHAHNSQNMDSFIRGLLHRFNRLIISKYATDYWTCSDEASKWFYNKKIINSNKYKIVYNAIDTKKYQFDDNKRKKIRKKLDLEDKLVITNIGRLHFQKNQEFVIKIFNEILKENKESILLLIGDGPDRKKLTDLVKIFKIEKKVKFLGIRKDVNDVMQAADVLLFPSLFEGLPLVMIEAQAADLLIYASKNKIDEKVIINKDRVNLISLEESDKYWASQIINKSKERYKRKSNNKLLANSNFDIKTEARKIQTFFEKKLINK